MTFIADKDYPKSTRFVRFKKHAKLWQGHEIGLPPVTVEASSPEDAKKKLKIILGALGYNVTDDKKWEIRQLPMAYYTNRPL